MSGSAFRPLTWFPTLICRFAERSVNALGCIKRPYALPAYHETARCSRPSDHHRRSLLITGVVRPVTTHCSHRGSYRRRTHTRSLAHAALTRVRNLIFHRKDQARSPVVQDSV